MANQRSINWTAAMRDLRAARSAPDAGFLASRAIEAARLDQIAKKAPAAPLVMGASYDRSAIMTAAIAHARAQRAKGSTAVWSQLVGSALRLVWARAKAARKAEAH
jgi:hypothetical protein